jgi:hypothetical protein
MGGNPLGSTFLGGGVDEFTTWYTTPDGSMDSGYYIAPNRTLAVQAEVVNYRAVEQKVYLTMDVEYLPKKVGRDSLSTLLTVTGCTGLPGWSTDKKQINVTSGEYPIQQDGTIINARKDNPLRTADQELTMLGGHLHDGGVAMELYLNNDLICNSEDSYGGRAGTLVENGQKWETISKMEECPKPMKVKKNDVMKMVAVYDTEKHPLRAQHGSMTGHAEEMGIFTFSFVPDKDT